MQNWTHLLPGHHGRASPGGMRTGELTLSLELENLVSTLPRKHSIDGSGCRNCRQITLRNEYGRAGQANLFSQVGGMDEGKKDSLISTCYLCQVRDMALVVMRAGHLALPLASCITQNFCPCISSGQHSSGSPRYGCCRLASPGHVCVSASPASCLPCGC